MLEKVKQLMSRLHEVEEALGQPDAFSDPKRFKALGQEHAHLTEIKSVASSLEKAEKDLVGAREMLAQESDEDFRKEIEGEIENLQVRLADLQQKLENLLIPPDPMDHCNTIMEIRAGTGGDEAALFVADCFRMYQQYAGSKGWSVEVISTAPSDLGGLKEVNMVLSGQNVYRLMKHEAGTHRVQRVPETEAQGRVHTSAITVAVFPEPNEEIEVNVEEKDLRIDTYRSSGAGGQHVNTTDSAVRITHLPTGIVVYCQEEKSQHKNRDKAMRLLKARILAAEEEKKAAELAKMRADQIGSGDRSERIRTYNFPQNRVTDHRINLTKYNLNLVMNGDLDDIINPLVAYFHQAKLGASE